MYCASFVTAKAISGLVPSIKYNKEPITVWYLLRSSEDAIVPFASGRGTYPAGRGVREALAFSIPQRCSTVFK